MSFSRNNNLPLQEGIQQDIRAFFDRYIENVKEGSSNGQHFTARCPFCDGGSKRVSNFYFNITYGYGLCHRATCGWTGKFSDLYHEITGEKYAGFTGVAAPSALTSLRQQLYTPPIQDYVYHDPNVMVEGAIPLTALTPDIAAWIERRGYDPDWMSEKFPCFLSPDHWGRVGFYVRTEGNEAYQLYSVTGRHERKTLNPKHEILSQHLFNYNAVKEERDVVFVHEGIFDVARTTQRELSAVAIFGTNISETQAYLLSQLQAREICLCLDGDIASAKFKKVETSTGKQFHKDEWFALTSADTCGKVISVMRLPPDKDPDDCSEDEFADAFNRRRIFTPNHRLISRLSAC